MRVARSIRTLWLGLALAGMALALALPTAAATTPVVTVSLTFDDGLASQYVLRSALARRELKGTFFVNSSTVGTSSSYLSWSQLSDLAADGNEIGGHTVDHADLTTLSASEAQRQVCDDRRVLMGNGFQITTFAYPFGGRSDLVKQIVANCGYNSARHAWGLCAPGETGACPTAESIPPADMWEIRATWGLRPWTTSADLRGVVERAQANGGGWVPFVFHHICDQGEPGCDPTYSNSPAVVSEFLDWLAQRSAAGDVQVKTVRQVIGGTEKPAPAPSNGDTTAPVSTIACGGSCTGWHASPVTVSLTATDSGGAGVAFIRYTIDGSEPTAASPVYSGPFSLSSTSTVKYRAWDKVGNAETTKSQTVQIDVTAPVSAILCNSASCSTGSYSGAVTVSLSAHDAESGIAAIRYTLDGSEPTSSSTTYSGPFSVSATTNVKYRAWDNTGNLEPTKSELIQIEAADATPPTSSITCNGSACSTGWYAAAVAVTLAATDDASGVAEIRYTTDGSEPNASSTRYAGPFSVAQTTTIKYRAWDNAGNVEATKSQLIQIDTTGPLVTLASPTDGQTISGNVKLTATASDGESGVARVEFYVDGERVGASNSSPYFVNWNTKKASKGTHTIHAVAFDAAGNSRSTTTITVTVK
jgi:peptidoglycan/xylan/chitin deacetylase (PgdA/CDA1 family)